MASYTAPPYYVQPTASFSPQPNLPPDEFNGLQYYDAFSSQPFPFEMTAATAPPSGPQTHTPHTNGGSMHRSISPAGGDSSNRTRGSSEEKELTPSQRRRKEQNRAAQRAFRERKERHVKELEQRLASLEQANSRAVNENNKLKEALEKARLENRLLHENSLRGTTPPEVGPMVFKPADAPRVQTPPPQFTSPIFGAHPNKGPIHRISMSPKTGEKLLGAGAAWDLIICHPLYEQGLVDIADISDRLKGLARCDGQGPVFEESVVLEAIHASSGSGCDELLVEGDSPMSY